MRTQSHDITIREADVSDAAAIARVHVDCWRTTYAGIVPEDYLANLSYSQREQIWHAALSASESPSFVYVAEDTTGEVVGFASAGQERSGQVAYKGELYAIYILASYQRRGIGRRLTQAVAKRLVEAGIHSMLVWVLADNPFRAFYEALGGQQVTEQEIAIGGAKLMEVAYGWRDVRILLGR